MSHRKRPHPPTCPYCGAPAKLVESAVIYGPGKPDYGQFWCCSAWPGCDAYVGCHPETTRPLGRLANAELRRWKQKAHAAFDRLWQRKMFVEGTPQKHARGLAYKWLAEQLCLPRERCHIGMLDVDDCQAVVELCTRPVLPRASWKAPAEARVP